MAGEVIHTFACPDEKCPGTAVPIAKDGRFFNLTERPWLLVCMPADWLIHRCNVCGADWLDADNQVKAREFLDAAYLEHMPIIDKSITDFRAKELAAAKAKR